MLWRLLIRAPHQMATWSIKSKNWEEAIDAFSKYLYLQNNSSNLAYKVYSLGEAYMQLFKYDKAYALFKKAEEIDPAYKKFGNHYKNYIEKREKTSTTKLIHLTLEELVGPIYY